MGAKKEVKIIPLVGKNIAEISATATAAVNEGGSVIGMTNVRIQTDIAFHDLPALVIIRTAVPETIIIADDDGEFDGSL